jgi:tetratricopeptide (TPR) repeat protein
MNLVGARAFLLAVGFACLPLTSVAQPGIAPPDAVGAAVREARAAINDGRSRDAIARLRALDAADRPEVAQLLGVALYHADDYAAAIDVLRGALDRLPADGAEWREAHQVLGLSLYVAGRFPEAVPHLEQTRSWAAGNTELDYVLGMAYIQTRKPDEARVALARAFGMSPDGAGAHVVTAQMMVRAEMEAPAETELRRALEKDPRMPQANYLLGQQAMFRGRLDEAIAYTRRELEISPANAMAFYQLGDAHGRKLEWDASIKALQQSLWLNPFYSGPYILLGKAYTRKGNTPAAEGMLRRAIEYDPNNRTAHYMLGQLLQQLGRADEARPHLELADKLPGVR